MIRSMRYFVTERQIGKYEIFCDKKDCLTIMWLITQNMIFMTFEQPQKRTSLLLRRIFELGQYYDFKGDLQTQQKPCMVIYAQGVVPYDEKW